MCLPAFAEIPRRYLINIYKLLVFAGDRLKRVISNYFETEPALESHAIRIVEK
jgi:hypothetical protein